jgi:hypothetical protein
MRYIIILLGLVLPVMSKAEEMNQAEKDNGIKAITKIFDRLNPVLAKYHLTPLTFTSSNLQAFHHHNVFGNVSVCGFNTSSKISLDFLPDSFEPIAFYNNNIKYDQGLGFDQPPSPKWTQEQAVATAKEYVVAIFGKFPKDDVGPPTVEFEKRRNAFKPTWVMKYFTGDWHIRWPRVDTKGYLFNADSVSIYISEDQGVTTAFYNFFSNYQEPQGPLISRDEALKIASPAAQSLIDKWLGPGLQLGSPKIVVEGIVNPNHALQAQAVADLAHKDTTARLAWVVLYNLTANGTPTTAHRVQVWVDAQTKEVVGGDLH